MEMTVNKQHQRERTGVYDALREQTDSVLHHTLRVGEKQPREYLTPLLAHKY